jgi:transposase
VLTAQQLVLAFLQLVWERAAESLEPWIKRARASGVAEQVEFANGLGRDRAAVEAALRYKWSNGITEGHVNRLKMLKRTAYGRPSFALFRQRGQQPAEDAPLHCLRPVL